jgi:serine protease Do
MTKVQPVQQKTKTVPKPVRILISLVLSFVAGGLGAWAILASGLVKIDASQTINQNRETLVLQQGEIISEVFKKVSPSTVSITIQTIDTSRRYFEPQISEGAGSGVIISKDGYVLTNKHVIPEGTRQITVVLADGKKYTDVTVIGRDPSNDIAFIKINGVSDLTPAEIGDSSTVTAGQQVAAIGNALGLFRNSITSGIISGTGRPIQAADGSGTSVEQLEDLFQTDAAINPGNSGGPLVNLKGEVIGINTAVSSQGQGIGFAIPINSAKGLMKGVLTSGKIIKPYLGVRYVSLDADIAAQLQLRVTKGALVRGTQNSPGVLQGSPADKAKLREGDVITRVNNQEVTPESGLASKLSQFSPGDKVELTVVRGGQEQKATITLEAYPQ